MQEQFVSIPAPAHCPCSCLLLLLIPDRRQRFFIFIDKFFTS